MDKGDQSGPKGEVETSNRAKDNWRKIRKRRGGVGHKKKDPQTPQEGISAVEAPNTRQTRQKAGQKQQGQVESHCVSPVSSSTEPKPPGEPKQNRQRTSESNKEQPQSPRARNKRVSQNQSSRVLELEKEVLELKEALVNAREPQSRSETTTDSSHEGMESVSLNRSDSPATSVSKEEFESEIVKMSAFNERRVTKIESELVKERSQKSVLEEVIRNTDMAYADVKRRMVEAEDRARDLEGKLFCARASIRSLENRLSHQESSRLSAEGRVQELEAKLETQGTQDMSSHQNSVEESHSKEKEIVGNDAPVHIESVMPQHYDANANAVTVATQRLISEVDRASQNMTGDERVQHVLTVNNELVKQLRFYVQVLSRRPATPLWVKDSDTKSCLKCSKSFNMMVRRHHCRCCGNVFCDDCSAGRAKMPWLGYKEKVRLCNLCIDRIQPLYDSPPTTGATEWM